MPETQPEPRYILDLYGVVEILETRNNAARSLAIEKIQTGEIRILKSVSRELKDMYPDTYKSFQDIIPKKYLTPETRHIATAGQLQSHYGTNILGGIPSPSNFEILAVAHSESLTVISAKKGLNRCQRIVRQCNLNGTGVITIDEFAEIELEK